MNKNTRKLIWAAPLLAVFAVAAALALFAAQTPQPASAHGAPGPVTGVTATAMSATEIKISWTAPASGTGGPVAGYRIDVSDDTLVWISLEDDTESTDTSYVHPGLKPETLKYYRVFALNSAGTGPSSIDPLFDDATTDEASVPSVVRNLQAKAVGSSKIELSWTAPADLGNAKIERYCIVADGLVSGATAAWPTDFDNLQDDNTANADPDEVENDCTATAQALTNGITAQTGDSSPTFANGFLIVVDGKKATYTLKEAVTENQEWRFRAYAKNSAGISSAASNIARASTSAIPDTGKPTDVRIAAVTSEGGTNTPDDFSDDSSTYSAINAYWNWPMMEGKAQDNIDGFRWQWRVKEATAAKWPPWKAIDSATDTMSVITAQGVETADAANFPTNNHHRQLNLTTVPAGFNGKNDQLQFRVQAARTVDTSDNSATGAGKWVESNVMTHQGLESDLEIPQNTATNANRTGFTRIRVPGPVTDLKIDSEESLNQINLTWKRGSDAIYSAIDVSTDTVTWTRLERNTRWSRETYNHRSLKPGQTFYYRVTPGHSTWGFGLAVANDGSTKAAVVPAPVRGLTVTANGQDKLDLSWPLINEANDGGSPIVGYLIQVANDTDNNSKLDTTVSDFAWEEVNDITTSVARVTDGAGEGSYTYTSQDDKDAGNDGLEAGSVRWFRVFAINSVNATIGTATPDTDDAPTPDDVASAEAKMGKTATKAKPGAPMYLVAETARDSNSMQRTELGVDLLWDRGELSAGDTITGYVIDRKVDDGEWKALLAAGTAHTGSDDTNYTDTEEPKTDEQRAYRVAAVSSGGQGPWSDVAYYPLMHAGDTGHIMAAADMTIPAQSVTAGMSTDAIDVSSYFTNNTGATYAAAPKTDDDGMYVSASVAEGTSMVTIMGVKATMADAPATVTVTATDMHGTMAMQDIKVTVMAANMAPMSEGMIDDMMATEGDMASTMDVMGYFSDADGDALTYSATSSDTAAATATIAEGTSMLTVTPMGAGTATVTVTATDADGSGMSATQIFMITVAAAPPVLAKPIITLANPVGSTSVGVDWTAVPGATSYVLYAVHLENGDITAKDVPPGQTSFSVSGLVKDDEYLIFVGVFAGAANYKLSDPERVTVE